MCVIKTEKSGFCRIFKRTADFYVALISLLCACVGTRVQETPLTGEETLQVRNNWKIRRVLGVDSLLCAQVIAVEGVVYFDDPLWKNLTLPQRKNLTECLDLKRGIRVGIADTRRGDIKVWSARLSEKEDFLFIGWLPGDCSLCDLRSGVAEYRLRREKDTLFIPKPLTQEELWR